MTGTLTLIIDGPEYVEKPWNQATRTLLFKMGFDSADMEALEEGEVVFKYSVGYYLEEGTGND